MYFYDYNLFVIRVFVFKRCFETTSVLLLNLSEKGTEKKLLDYSVQKASEQYFISDELVEEFDKTFEPKEKLKLQGQLF